MGTTQFERLVASGRQIGEVVGVDRCVVRVRGLQAINVHALILFADGSKGYVQYVCEDYSVVLHLGSQPLTIGTIGVVQHDALVARVGKNYVGRVISVLGEPLDDKGPITPDGTWPIFHDAPLLHERELLDAPFETGITILDSLFPLAKGQRMALVGDDKTGKTSLATRIVSNQRGGSDVTLYVLIAKQPAELTMLIRRLEATNAMAQTIVIAATVLDALVVNYLAPYVAAAMGEYFWQQCDMDTLVVYDDLTNHAMVHQELSLLAERQASCAAHGGDITYAHASLLERAGKLRRNHKTQTVLPIVYTPNSDMTTPMATNSMAITDGQWVFDGSAFGAGRWPAIDPSLSMTAAGTVGQDRHQKALAARARTILLTHKRAEEHAAQRGDELTPALQDDFVRGASLYHVLNQPLDEAYTAMEQRLLLGMVTSLGSAEQIDIGQLKQRVHDSAATIADGGDLDMAQFETVQHELKAACCHTPNDAAEQQPDQAAHHANDEAARNDGTPVNAAHAATSSAPDPSSPSNPSNSSTLSNAPDSPDRPRVTTGAPPQPANAPERPARTTVRPAPRPPANIVSIQAQPEKRKLKVKVF